MSPRGVHIKDIATIAVFAALTAAGAYVSLPVGTVPVTLQTLISLLSGLLLGARKGALSQVVYLLLGISGLPVFAGGAAGIGYLFGPTGGFLLGFIACSFAAGLISENGDSLGRHIIAAISGTIVLYLFGLPVLMLFCHFSLSHALLIGFVPFLPVDILKIIVAVLVTRKVAPHLARPR